MQDKAEFLRAVRCGSLSRLKQLIHFRNSVFKEKFPGGYDLLCEAFTNRSYDIINYLLKKKVQVNVRGNKPGETPLHLAIKLNSDRFVRMVLDNGAIVNCVDENNSTPLHYAIERRQIKIIYLLLKHGADVTFENYNGETPLHISAKQNVDLEIVQSLLRYGASVNCICQFGENAGFTPLHFAVKNGNIKMVKCLINAGATITVSKNGTSPLHLAIVMGYIDIALYLVDFGVDINLTCNMTQEYCFKNWAPIHLACFARSERLAKLFLDKGVDINITTEDNLTPLHIAAQRKAASVVELLLENGAEVDAEGGTPSKMVLHYAVESGDLKVVETVLKYNPDINNASNRKAFISAIHHKGTTDEGIVKSLQTYGFKLCSDDKNNPELFHGAARNGRVDIVEELLNYCIDIHVTWEDYWQALHSAASTGQYKVTKCLLAHGADPNALDKFEKTPIMYAIENFAAYMSTINEKLYGDIMNTFDDDDWGKTIDILIEHGADINHLDIYGRSVFYFVMIGTRYKESLLLNIAKILFRRGYKINKLDYLTEHLICNAIMFGFYRLVDVLIKHGAELDYGPLHLAIEYNSLKMFETLIDFGADVNCHNNMRQTPLHIACKKGNFRMIRTLLENGADVNIENRTPFHSALTSLLNRLPHITWDSFEMYYCSDYMEEDNIYFCDVKKKIDAVFILLQHIIQLQCAGLYVSNCILATVYKEQNFEKIINYLKKAYNEEIDLMQRKIIGNSKYCFYDILTMSSDQIEKFLRNEDIVELIQKSKTEFRFYWNMINGILSVALKRQELIKKSYVAFNTYFESFHLLPQNCVEKICSYLSIQDFKLLLISLEPEKTSYSED